MQPHEGGPRPDRTPIALARLLAWALPVLVASWRTTTLPHWRSDLGLLRDVALTGVGFGGGVSTALVQLATLAPLGSLSFRATLVSIAALGALSAALFELAHRALVELEPRIGDTRSRWLAPGLAALAALAPSMTPALQGEATAAGSALVGVALAAWTLVAGERVLSDPLAPRRWLPLAAGGLGLASGELLFAGLAAGVALVGALGARKTLPAASLPRMSLPPRLLWSAAALCVAGVAIAAAPSLLRPFAPNAALDVGQLGLAPPLLEPPAEARLGVLAAVVLELGLVPGALAAVGLAVLALHPRSRSLGAALVALTLLDLLLPSGARPHGADPALRALSLGAVGVAHVAGAFYAVTRLVALRIPMARAAAAMLVAFDATVVALVVEQAGESADREAQLGAFEWTRAALVPLEPSAALYVESATTTWRLLAAQLVEGRRPDVVVVPLGLLDRGRVASDLLVAERRLEPLLRSVALRGRADEYALSELAHARPLHAELDRSWDARTLTHATLDGPWLALATQPFGKSDRRADIDGTLVAMRRLLATATAPGCDPRTQAVVGGTMRGHAKALLRLGDAPSAIRYLAELDTPGAKALVTGASLDVRFAGAAAKLASARRASVKPTSATRAGSAPPRRR